MKVKGHALKVNWRLDYTLYCSFEIKFNQKKPKKTSVEEIEEQFCM